MVNRSGADSAASLLTIHHLPFTIYERNGAAAPFRSGLVTALPAAGWTDLAANLAAFVLRTVHVEVQAPGFVSLVLRLGHLGSRLARPFVVAGLLEADGHRPVRTRRAFVNVRRGAGDTLSPDLGGDGSVIGHGDRAGAGRGRLHRRHFFRAGEIDLDCVVAA